MKNGQRRRSPGLGTQTDIWGSGFGGRGGGGAQGTGSHRQARTDQQNPKAPTPKPQNHPESGAQEQDTARPRHPPTRKTMNLKQQGIKRGRDKSKALADRRACRDSQTRPKQQTRTQDEEPRRKH